MSHAAESEIRHGTKIGRFVVVGELGAGGMGVVYAGHDRELDRKVALKVLRASATTDEDRMRMLREGQAMARITHPNVITVFEVGTEGNLVFLAQELLDGGTLGQWLAEPRSHAEILEKLVAAGRGLAAAHQAGLVHRDFKPDNVLLGKDGRVRVADFGLARALGAVGEQLAVTRPNRTSDTAVMPDPMSALTRTGTVMGTPLFMAPEQHEGVRADERSDQFSFCVALYHALYGDWPYDGKTSVALADAVINGRRKSPPRGKSVPSKIQKVIDRGLATKAEERYPSMEALLAELTAQSGNTKRVLLAAAGLAVVAGAAVAAFVVMGGNKPESTTRDAAVAVAQDAATGSGPAEQTTHATDEKLVDELFASLERGDLDGPIKNATALAKQEAAAGDAAHASIASSQAAYLLALRGRMTEAHERYDAADADKGKDPLALAYADLAGAQIARMRGEYPVAFERASRCVGGFSATPLLAALCHQVLGEVAIDDDDVTSARKAFEQVKAIAGDKHPYLQLSAELSLASLDLATIELDKITELQQRAVDVGSLDLQSRARVLVARAHLAKDATAEAYATLRNANVDKLQPFAVRLEHLIMTGNTRGVNGEFDAGYEQIDKARTEAEKQHAMGLVFDARLARLEVQLTEAAAAEAAKVAEAIAAVKSQLGALVEDAKKHGFDRIARLAEAATAE